MTNNKQKTWSSRTPLLAGKIININICHITVSHEPLRRTRTSRQSLSPCNARNVSPHYTNITYLHQELHKVGTNLFVTSANTHF